MWVAVFVAPFSPLPPLYFVFVSPVLGFSLCGCVGLQIRRYINVGIADMEDGEV